MPTLLEGRPGRVIAIDDPNMQGVLPLVRLDGTPNNGVAGGAAAAGDGGPVTFQERKSLITRVVVAQEANFQFAHMLGGDIYVYVFGDRIGQMTVSGLSVAQTCDDPKNAEHGFERMLKWYKAVKISKRKTPVTTLIGSTPISGFVTGMTGGVFDHRLMLMQFDLTIMVLPEKD